MKCLCGFNEEDPENQTIKYGFNDRKFSGPKEVFIRINGSFTISADNDYYSGCIRPISIYACPKCSTLKMNEY